jgi:hypothetical protein
MLGFLAAVAGEVVNVLAPFADAANPDGPAPDAAAAKAGPRTPATLGTRHPACSIHRPRASDPTSRVEAAAAAAAAAGRLAAAAAAVTKARIFCIL